jgi:hypothetical protein
VLQARDAKYENCPDDRGRHHKSEAGGCLKIGSAASIFCGHSGNLYPVDSSSAEFASSPAIHHPLTKSVRGWIVPLSTITGRSRLDVANTRERLYEGKPGGHLDVVRELKDCEGL